MAYSNSETAADSSDAQQSYIEKAEPASLDDNQQHLKATEVIDTNTEYNWIIGWRLHLFSLGSVFATLTLMQKLIAY